MAWFISRSIVVIVPTFVLGLVVGWLWWRRRKVQFSESQALVTTVARKDAEIRARDDEIARLSTAGEAVTASDAGTDEAPEEAAPPAPADKASDSAPRTAPPQVAPPAQVDPTAGMVLVPTDPAPEQYAAHAIPVDDIPTGGISLQEIMDVQATRKAMTAAELDVPDTAQPPVRRQARADATTAEPVDREPQGAPADHEMPEDHGAPSTNEFSQVIDVTATEEAVSARLVDVTDAEEDEGDDLERVEGIGPRIGAALRKAGIHTFRELADADTATLQGALEQAGLRFAPTLPTWSRQARFLADGDEAGFQALTQQLAGGRSASRTK